ncbi:MAG: hypothetical protein HQ488_04765 [Parcubacteria group bacterium]|nr:hypothetical protein [Parcubacteria group bacterium]
MKRREFKVDGRTIQVGVLESLRQLLHSRSFQGRGKALAGNFAYWDNLAQMIDSHWFRTVALPALLVAQSTAAPRTVFTVELDHPKLVGWTTIGWDIHPAFMAKWEDDDGHHHEPIDVGPIEFTEVSFGNLHVALTPDIPPPMTHKVTFIAKSHMHRGVLNIELLNARPGIEMPVTLGIRIRHAKRYRHSAPYNSASTGFYFWEFGAEGDDPSDPLWTYGAHLDNDPRLHLLTGETLPPADVEWYFDDEEPQRAAG